MRDLFWLLQTLQSLGFVISTQKHIELLKNIPIDAQGLASFDGKWCWLLAVESGSVPSSCSSCCLGYLDTMGNSCLCPNAACIL